MSAASSSPFRITRRRVLIASAALAVMILAVIGVRAYVWWPLERYEPGLEKPLRGQVLSPPEYDRLHPHAEPYVVEIQADTGAVLLFGSRHTFDPADPQLDSLHAAWTRLDPDVVLVEGRLGLFVPLFGDPVRAFGEMGAAYAIARDQDVPAYSWEPPRDRVLRRALETHAAERVALFFVLRPYFGRRSEGPVSDPGAFVEDVREDRTEWPGLEGTLPSVAAIDSTWQRAFPDGPDWREVAYRTGLPGFLDDIHHRVNQIRDEHLLEAIVDLVRSGRRVFVVAGSSHAARLERALLTELAPRDSVLLPEMPVSNEQFREVRVQRLADHTFWVRGNAQVFEGTVSYAIEDGHYRLAEGTTTAERGAPEWGAFDFVFSYEPGPHGAQTRPMLILYEESAKTGAPTHELVVPLELIRR